MKELVKDTGLNIPKDCTEEEFYEVGKFLASIEHGCKWAIGDWYNAIRDNNIPKDAPWQWATREQRDAACKKAGLHQDTARKYGGTAKLFSAGRRRPAIDFSVYDSMRCISGRPDFGEFVNRVEEESWTGSKVRKECKALLGISKNTVPERFTREVDEIVDSLPDRVGKKVKEDVKTVFKTLQHDFEKVVEKEVRSRRKEDLYEEKNHIKSIREDIIAAQKRITEHLGQHIDCVMTFEDYKFILACLHPDRQPDDQKEKFARAFAIFKKVRDTVDTTMPISLLRDHGWDKIHPRYKN